MSNPFGSNNPFDVGGGGGTGPPGPPGPAATIEIGTTTTVPPGTPAEVTNSGTAQHAVLDFKIPGLPAGTIWDFGETLWDT